MQRTTIGMSFDPMLATLIAYGADRESAIDRLDRALRDYVILGVKNNISWLRRHHLVRIEPFDLVFGPFVVRSRLRSKSDFAEVGIELQPLLADRRAH
jgi:hypothetical protein